MITRRDLLRSAAGAALLSLAGCTSPSSRTGSPVEAPEATTSSTAKPLRSVALIGDSISYLADDALQAALRGVGYAHIEFDARPGRRIADGDMSGLMVLDYALGQGLAPDLWIIELGTNDLGHYDGYQGYAALIDLVVQRLPPPTPLVWVDTYSSFGIEDCDLFNVTLRDAMAARGTAEVAGWYAKCVEVGPTSILRDGLHPLESAYTTFAEVTVEPIERVT